MSRTTGNKDFWLAALRAEGSAFRAAVEQPDAQSRPVPSCPEWTVGDLTRHLGSVYQRVRSNAGSGDANQPWPKLGIAADAPAVDDPALIGWFRNELSQIIAFLDQLDPDLPAWNFAPQARTAGFYHRRMAHETAMHRWDAQLATGGLAEPLESKLAGDTVAEVLDTMLPAGRRRVSADATGVVHLVATDLGHEWTARLRGQGIALLDTDTLLDDDAHPARAAASGTASDLALAMWGRVTFDVVETRGDLSLLEALRIS